MGVVEQEHESHEPDRAWSATEAGELQRSRDRLEGVQARLDNVRTTSGLPRQTVAEMIHRAAVDLRQAACVLDDLALSFER